eukprot:1151986-Pelagomonas_calceolata.AAC.2
MQPFKESLREPLKRTASHRSQEAIAKRLPSYPALVEVLPGGTPLFDQQQGSQIKSTGVTVSLFLLAAHRLISTGYDTACTLCA